MPRRFLLTASILSWALLLVSAPVFAQTETPVYEIDSDHTRVVFSVDHLGFSRMPGFFNDIEGTIRFDPNDAAQSQVDILIHARGITMGNRVLDEKLRGPDYFNIAKYPTIRFRGTRIERTGMEDGKLTGMLTLLGVSRPVTLDVHFNRKGLNPFTNMSVLGFTATGKLDRSEFGLKTMLPDVGNEVKLDISVEAYVPTAEMKAKKQQAKAARAKALAEQKAIAEAAAKKKKEEEKAASAVTAAPDAVPGATGGMKLDPNAPSPYARPPSPVELLKIPPR
jgi:polyisoprenoid-binding protein YceI